MLIYRLSGRFFIRYKGPVVRYWCVHNDMVCETTSSARATPFVIWIAERGREYDDKIMIGTDEVHISIGERCDKTIYFHRESEDEDGDPKLRVHTVGGGPRWPPVPAKFIFSSFENGFIVGELLEPESGSYMYDKQIVGPILKTEGSGRRWELV